MHKTTVYRYRNEPNHSYNDFLIKNEVIMAVIVFENYRTLLYIGTEKCKNFKFDDDFVGY